VSEYVAFYDKNVVPAIQAAAHDLTPEASLMCGLAAYVFPDRVPYLLYRPAPSRETSEIPDGRR
jgi:hypothetical protein